MTLLIKQLTGELFYFKAMENNLVNSLLPKSHQKHYQGVLKVVKLSCEFNQH